MATPDEALAKMREICLSLPNTREGDHFGEAAFYVSGKLFATCGAKSAVCQIIFGLEPAHAAALVRRDRRYTPYPRDKRGVVVDAADVQSWGEVEGFLRESYELQKPKPKPPPPAPKKREASSKKKSVPSKKRAKKSGAKKSAAKRKLTRR